MRRLGDTRSDRSMYSIVDGVEPLKILGATKDSLGQVFFLIKWSDPYGARLVDAQTANVRWPQLRLQSSMCFYVSDSLHTYVWQKVILMELNTGIDNQIKLNSFNTFICDVMEYSACSHSMLQTSLRSLLHTKMMQMIHDQLTRHKSFFFLGS
uniref:Chromo shadow domain-containing protein n=1 Tax=Glossina austeni TaxID=7395 RepID=A0A1A9V4Q5_GLOAU